MEEEEEKWKPKTYPCVFHNIDEEKKEIEDSIALLKPILESFNVNKIQKSIIKLESPNENERKKVAGKILRRAVMHKCDTSIIRRILLIEIFYQVLPYKVLENQAAKYFIDNYRVIPEQISFVEKTKGVQLGRKIVIALSPFESKSFYIKTHRGGSKNDTSVSDETKSVDPKEILVYSVLQTLHLGPEVHYFWENSKNFYIATSDLNEIGNFTEYKKICGSLPDPLNLQTLDAKHLQICNELIKLDLFSRIFRLSDTILNKGNFGFVEKDGYQNLFLVDFIVKDDYSYALRSLFEGFLASVGSFSYLRNIDPTIKYSLNIRSADEKCNIATNFLNDFNVREALKEGYRRASDISISLGMPLEDLKNYYKGVKMNIQQFKTGLGLDK